MERMGLRPRARDDVKTAVALIIFRRPDLTARVLDTLRVARPPLLLVIADGPRANHAGDAAACSAARALIDTVDWPCEVRREFAAENLGCRRRVASGLRWVFDQVPEAIILEDDCVPDQSFFPFCEQLLERYRDDDRVGLIGGANNQKGRKRGTHSYFFSRYPNVWGWATWRRAFDHYDVDMKKWPELRETDWLAQLLGSDADSRYWTRVLDDTYAGRVDTWDYQWIFSSWLHGMLALTPNNNLVQNIGFGDDATHTAKQDAFANSSLQAIEFPLDHPRSVVVNASADRFTSRLEFTGSFVARARRTIRARLIAPIKRRLRLALNIRQRVDYPGFAIELPADHLLPMLQRMFRQYDRFLPHLASYLEAGDVVFDVGANCGDTLAAMCSANGALSFVCVEPDVRFFSFLKQNVARIREALPNVSIVLTQDFVSAREDFASLAGAGGTKTVSWRGDLAGAENTQEAAHRAVRLDAIATAARGIDAARVRLLKSDVDGYDFDVLDSAGAMLDGPRLLLFFECFAENEEQREGYLALFERLYARGYNHFRFFDNFGRVHRGHVTDLEAARGILREVWTARGDGGGPNVDYLDVLAYRNADFPFIERVMAGYPAD
jgi:FkbM family methyltransferase